MTTLSKITVLSLYLCTWITSTHAQTRIFLDIPQVSYFNANVGNMGERMGLDVGIDLNFASHFMVARVGTGSSITIGTQRKEIEKSLFSSIYGKMETGIGLYRTNGKRCSLGHSSAFTALAMSGVRFSHLTQDANPEKRREGTTYGLNGFDFYAGIELGYFFIRDMYKNYDFFLRGDYLMSKDAFTANAGVKLFLNLKANRNYKL